MSGAFLERLAVASHGLFVSHGAVFLVLSTSIFLGERRHVAAAQIEAERDECDQLGNYKNWPKVAAVAGASPIARLADARAFQAAQLQYSMTEAV